MVQKSCIEGHPNFIFSKSYSGSPIRKNKVWVALYACLLHHTLTLVSPALAFKKAKFKSGAAQFLASFNYSGTFDNSSFSPASPPNFPSALIPWKNANAKSDSSPLVYPAQSIGKPNCGQEPSVDKDLLSRQLEQEKNSGI